MSATDYISQNTDQQHEFEVSELEWQQVPRGHVLVQIALVQATAKTQGPDALNTSVNSHTIIRNGQR